MDDAERTRWIQPEGKRVLPQHVKHALSYMRANLAERIMLHDLASACAVSKRTLIRQFKNFVGVAPLAYLRRLRLNTAKVELANPKNDQPIADIAGHCGFYHLGRFASEYRRLFGEAPSTTRQRAQQRPVASVSASQPVAAMVGSSKPSLLLLALRTETLQENIEGRDVTERLAAALSRTRVASVAIAHSSRLPGTSPAQPRNAGAQYCLLGRLMKHDKRTRIIVRLVDVVSDRHVWGDSFDGSADDPFELQDRVVDAVLCSVVAHIADAEFTRARHADTRDLGARDLAMRAMPLILCGNATSVHKAIAILNRAVELDPGDAVAVALLAFSQYLLVPNYATESPATAIEAAARLSQRARSLDNNDPLVLVACGGIAHGLRASDEGDALLARALAIDPTSAWAWERRALSLRPCIVSGPKDSDQKFDTRQSADQAIAGFQRALKFRGPGSSRSNCFGGIASAHFMAARWDEAGVWLRKAMAENPGDTSFHRNVFNLAFKTGDRGTMVRSVEHLRRAHPSLTVSYHADAFPSADPLWLEALRSAGMPLS